jgi:Uma2 family endonuclease
MARTSETGVFNPDVDKSYRVPDVSIGHPEHVSERGFEGAVLVVEVLSPNDESRKKFDFYARVGVREVWLIEPKTRETELYALRADRTGYEPILFPGGIATSPALGITLEIVGGPLLRLRDGAETYEI